MIDGPVEHGTIVRVGKPRRDGKLPVSFTFKSTGARINKVMTREALDAQLAKYAGDPSVQIFK